MFDKKVNEFVENQQMLKTSINKIEKKRMKKLRKKGRHIRRRDIGVNTAYTRCKIKTTHILYSSRFKINTFEEICLRLKKLH